MSNSHLVSSFSICTEGSLSHRNPSLQDRTKNEPRAFVAGDFAVILYFCEPLKSYLGEM